MLDKLMFTWNYRVASIGLLLLLLCCNIAAHVQSYSESVEYGAPMRYDYIGQQQQHHQQQEAPQRGRYRQPQLQQQKSTLQLHYNRQSPGTGAYELSQGQEPAQLGREYQLRSFETVSNREQHKCRIWVPSETVDKYVNASVIQEDQANQLSSIEICCTGYSPTRLRGVTLCRPICSCLNGNCRVPGECECYEGYAKNDNGDCVFTCPLGCQNGRCYLDGSCQCDAGYKLDETRKFCRPICSAGCGNNVRHNCTEPEVCGCSKGYTLNDEGCQPVCDPDCGIGGLCREHNECSCGAGYQLKDGVCQTDCYQTCHNGKCISRNRCICNAGFTYHEHSSMCVPT